MAVTIQEGLAIECFFDKPVHAKVGDTVTKGQLIGLIGDTGRVTGPHLHFEVWVNGIQVQPFEWLNHIYP